MEKASFEFGVKSRAYEERLRDKGQWEKFNVMRENAKMDLLTYKADYDTHREKRIADKCKEIADKQKLTPEGPKIGGGPNKRPLTADEIKAKSEFLIDDGHKRGYKARYEQHQTGINQFVEKALRLPKGFSQSRSGWLSDKDSGRD